MLIFSFQVLLLLFLTAEIVRDYFDPTAQSAFVFTDEKSFHKSFYTYCTMFICAVILHIYQQPEIIDSINRIRFIANHPHKFERIAVPISICFMKLFIDISVEAVSIIFTAAQTQVQDVIMNFIAMFTIS